jgi:hypothetical protein
MPPDELEDPRHAEAVSPPSDGLLDVEMLELEYDGFDTLAVEGSLTEWPGSEPGIYEDPPDPEEELRDALLEANPDASPADIEESLFNVPVPRASAEEPLSPGTGPLQAKGLPPTEVVNAPALTVEPGTAAAPTRGQPEELSTPLFDAAPAPARSDDPAGAVPRRPGMDPPDTSVQMGERTRELASWIPPSGSCTRRSK